MTWLVPIDAAVVALSFALRVYSARHYLRNWRSRPRRNPESMALVLEIAMNAFGGLMGLSAAMANDLPRVRAMVAMTMAVQAVVGANLIWAIRMSRRMYAVQEDRES